MSGNNHTVWHNGYMTMEARNRLNRHDSGVIWFTGLSASGKSTIAHLVEERLFNNAVRAYVFDGDNIRHGLNSNLGFSTEDRKENIRRIVEVASLFVDAGVVVLAAFITPLKEQREFIKERFKGIKFIEVYVKCRIQECLKRDPKGLYKKAQQGIISNYTGISSPYDTPENPDLVIDTEELTIEESVSAVLGYIGDTDFLGLKKYYALKT